MNIQSDCLECLLNQSIRVAKNLNLDKDKSKELLDIASSCISKYSEVTPVVVASDMYPQMSSFLKKEDIYRELKDLSTLEALKLLPSVKKSIERFDNRVKGAIKASVAGNVIDFATPNHFDLSLEFEKVFDTPFTIDDEDEFLERLSNSQSLMIVGDNVGEHVFDKLLLKEITYLYPKVKLYYAVRGVPIINDVTLKEAKEIDIGSVATIVDSGVDTPGLDYNRASSEFMELYNSIDLIIAKGMGNYEALEGLGYNRIYHLFKVKCSVVSSTVGADLGSLIFKRN